MVIVGARMPVFCVRVSAWRGDFQLSVLGVSVATQTVNHVVVAFNIPWPLISYQVKERAVLSGPNGMQMLWFVQTFQTIANTYCIYRLKGGFEHYALLPNISIAKTNITIVINEQYPVRTHWISALCFYCHIFLRK